MAIRRPAEVFAPGEFLRDEIEERGWTQMDLAEVLARPVGLVNEIISGKRGISAETARGLSAAFGTTPEFWMNLEAAYQLSRVRDDDGDGVTRRARLYEKAPIKDMVRRGWLEPSDSVEVLEARVLRFFRIDRVDEEPELPLHAARKATPYEAPLTVAQRAWLFRASHLATAVDARPYDKDGIEEVVGALRPLLQSPQEIRRVPRILSDAGIRFVIVQPLPGSRIDGACFWRDGAPTIVLSLRFDRIDSFWFVLLHELGHVAQGIASLDSDLDVAGDHSEKPKAEREADAFAVEHLVPSRQLDGFIARVRPLYSARKIEAFASTMNVHPAVVVGQLQHRGEIAFSSFRKLVVPVRDRITSAALTDGWGTALPAEL